MKIILLATILKITRGLALNNGNVRSKNMISFIPEVHHTNKWGRGGGGGS